MAPIYVLIGTKAQYIKMAPILRRLDSRNVPYTLIDTAQHENISLAFRHELKIKAPDIVLSQNSTTDTRVGIIIWMLRILRLAILQPKQLCRRVFPRGKGICLIHGDTASTLLGLVLGKRAGMKIAHVEAGLRSFNYLRPFPEEIIRVSCMRFCDYLFAPSDWATDNLTRMHIRGSVYNTKQNTNIESLYFSLESINEDIIKYRPYCLVSIHRYETIFRKSRLKFAVEQLIETSAQIHVIFVVHDVTKKMLKRFGLWNLIVQQTNIEITNLMPHSKFLSIIMKSAFVVTDGGSVQEECFYLNVPCLVLRKETERQEGVNRNVELCCFDASDFQKFVTRAHTEKKREPIQNKEPSKAIIDVITCQALES